LGCTEPRCRKSFHIPCAFLTGSGVCEVNPDDYSLCCSRHLRSL
jgi:hypothetical protein